MPWINLRPTNSGGGRKSGEATAKLYDSGQLTVSHAACAMLGDPAKVRVSYELESQRIRLVPTTPDDAGGFALSGGGNSQHRLGLKALVTAAPKMLGEYKAVKISGGIELRKIEE